MPGQPGCGPVSAGGSSGSGLSSDHEELRSLLQRYARAADERDVDTLATLFHPDAELAGARGVESLAEFLTGMRAQRTFPTSMHMMTDPLIVLDPGLAAATLDTYAVVYQLSDRASDRADLTLGVRYLDDTVRHEGRWVLRRRNSQTLWMR